MSVAGEGGIYQCRMAILVVRDYFESFYITASCVYATILVITLSEDGNTVVADCEEAITVDHHLENRQEIFPCV